MKVYAYFSDPFTVSYFTCENKEVWEVSYQKLEGLPLIPKIDKTKKLPEDEALFLLSLLADHKAFLIWA